MQQKPGKFVNKRKGKKFRLLLPFTPPPYKDYLCDKEFDLQIRK